MASSLRSLSKTGLAALAMTGVAIALRLWIAGTTAYIWDEREEWIPAASSISVDVEEWHLPVFTRFHPATAAYVIRLSTAIFGWTEVGSRALNVLLGGVSVLILFLFTRRWAGPGTAVVAALLLAFNEYHIAASAQATQRSLHLFLSLLALIAFAAALRDERPSHPHFAAVSAALAAITYEIQVLLLPVFVVSLAVTALPRWFSSRSVWKAVALWILIVAPVLLVHSLLPESSGGPRIGFLSRLALLNGPDLTAHYLLFYLRDVARFVGIGFYSDPGAEFAAMNGLFGILLLLAGLVAATRFRQLDHVERFLAIFFWSFLGFFSVVGMSASSMVDTRAWWWIDATLLPAILLAARLLSQSTGIARLGVAALVLAGSLQSASETVRHHLGMPTL